MSDVGDALPEVYDELRGIAARVLGSGGRGSLAPTGIVHEAYIRLSEKDARWGDRHHFLSLAARCMRQVIVDHHRRKSTAKRGGDWQRVTLSDAADFERHGPVDALALDELLTELEACDPRQARVVELRFFSGMTNAEIAEELGVSIPTIEREWRHARAWLAHGLRQS